MDVSQSVTTGLAQDAYLARWPAGGELESDRLYDILPKGVPQLGARNETFKPYCYSTFTSTH